MAGFRLAVTGGRALKGTLGVDRAGNPTSVGGQFVELDMLPKALREQRRAALRPAAEELMKALKRATPVYQPHERDFPRDEDGKYGHAGLKGGWYVAPGYEDTSASGTSVTINNDVKTMTGTKRWSVLDLVLYGAGERTVTAKNAPFLVFPDRGGHALAGHNAGIDAINAQHKIDFEGHVQAASRGPENGTKSAVGSFTRSVREASRGTPRSRKTKEIGQSLVRVKVSHPRAYKGNRFDQKVTRRMMPEIKARLQKSATQAVLKALEEWE